MKFKLKKNPDPQKCAVARCTKPMASQYDFGSLCLKHAEEYRAPEEPEEEQALESWRSEVKTKHMEFEEVLEMVQGFEMVDDEDISFATEALADTKTQWNELEAKRKSITQPINKALKEVNALFKPAQNALKQIETLWKSKMRDLREAREKEQRAMLLAANEKNNPAAVRETLILASDTTFQADGVSFRDNWKFRIVDESKIPREYLTPDLALIGKEVRGLKGKVEIPGVEIYNEQIVTARAK